VFPVEGLASMRIWSRSDRWEQSPITCDQVHCSAQVSVICCTN